MFAVLLSVHAIAQLGQQLVLQDVAVLHQGTKEVAPSRAGSGGQGRDAAATGVESSLASAGSGGGRSDSTTADTAFLGLASADFAAATLGAAGVTRATTAHPVAIEKAVGYQWRLSTNICLA